MSQQSSKPEAPKSGGWIKPAVEYGPIVLFFISYKIWGLMPATAVLVAASVAATIVGYLRAGRLPWAPIITTAIVVVFGLLTLIFHDDTFIKMKPTVVYTLFAATLWGGLLLKKPLMERLMGTSLKMDHAGWRKLEARFALFCAGMAVLNEVVWRTQTENFWVNFKFGSIFLTFLFMATQLPMIKRHMLPDPAESESKGAAGE
ncbi:septation protein A [Dongia sp.]|uniref:septation protein A n=1 Tax=Dongia sp. TaxID=1977262 RepID=UPI003751639D